jgi:hypothetical protein
MLAHRSTIVAMDRRSIRMNDGAFNTLLASIEASTAGSRGRGDRDDGKQTESPMTRLDIVNRVLTEPQIESLCSALEMNTTITDIDADNSNLLTLGASRFATMLTTNTFITELSLDNVQLTEGQIESLCSALEANTTIAKINARKSNLTALGASRFASMLTKNTSITSLILAGIQLTEPQIESLCSALEVNTTITDINVGGSNLNTGGSNLLTLGASRFASMLTKNTFITNLDLSQCGITDPYLEILCSALAHNRTLEALNLWLNEITEEGQESLVRGLQSNDSITCAYIGDQLDTECDFNIISYSYEDTEDAKAIQALVQRNKRNKHQRNKYWIQAASLIASLQASASPNTPSFSSSTSSSTSSLAHSNSGFGGGLYGIRNSIRYSPILPTIRSFLIDPEHYPYDHKCNQYGILRLDTDTAERIDALGCSAVHGMSDQALDVFLNLSFTRSLEKGYPVSVGNVTEDEFKAMMEERKHMKRLQRDYTEMQRREAEMKATIDQLHNENTELRTENKAWRRRIPNNDEQRQHYHNNDNDNDNNNDNDNDNDIANDMDNDNDDDAPTHRPQRRHRRKK